MSDIDPMDYLRLQTEHNALINKHNDLRQATKLLCESINDGCIPKESIVFYELVRGLLD